MTLNFPTEVKAQPLTRKGFPPPIVSIEPLISDLIEYFLRRVNFKKKTDKKSKH